MDFVLKTWKDYQLPVSANLKPVLKIMNSKRTLDRKKTNDSELYAKDYFQNVSQKLSHCTYLM